MSRIGNKIIVLPEGVEVKIEAGLVTVKGKNGEQKVSFNAALIGVNQEEKTLKVTRVNDEKVTKQLHGTTRALLNNAVVGVSQGFKKELEIVGIGYHADMKGKDLVLTIGYSHPVKITPLEGVTITCPDQNTVVVTGQDKFKVGQTAALIHDVRKPEPYKGKGIKYKNEYILRKEGKRAGA